MAATGLSTLGRWGRADWRERFLGALGTPILLFFTAMVLIRPVRGHWAAPGYLTLLILSSATVAKGGPWGRRLLDASAVLLAGAVVLLPVVLAFTPAASRAGWAFLGEKVGRRKPAFIVCNDYHVASQLGYVLRTNESWDLTPVGRPAKSFPNWWDEKSRLGRNAVVVLDDRHYPGELDRIKECFERVDGPEPVDVPRLRLGRFGGDERYWVLSAWNYRGARVVSPRAADPED